MQESVNYVMIIPPLFKSCFNRFPFIIKDLNIAKHPVTVQCIENWRQHYPLAKTV